MKSYRPVSCSPYLLCLAGLGDMRSLRVWSVRAVAVGVRRGVGVAGAGVDVVALLAGSDFSGGPEGC